MIANPRTIKQAKIPLESCRLYHADGNLQAVKARVLPLEPLQLHMSCRPSELSKTDSELYITCFTLCDWQSLLREHNKHGYRISDLATETGYRARLSRRALGICPKGPIKYHNNPAIRGVCELYSESRRIAIGGICQSEADGPPV